jgi:hypothetical protein
VQESIEARDDHTPFGVGHDFLVREMRKLDLGMYGILLRQSSGSVLGGEP